MPHLCNLAAKEDELECTCVNNNDFTVLVSGSGTCLRVSVCTVWPCIQDDRESRTKNFHQTLHWALTFLHGNYSDDSEGHSYGQLVIGSFITTMSPLMHHISCRAFGETSNHPGDSVSLHPRFDAQWVLDFPKTKIPFEREEISDHQWDSGKYDGAADEYGDH